MLRPSRAVTKCGLCSVLPSCRHRPCDCATPGVRASPASISEKTHERFFFATFIVTSYRVDREKSRKVLREFLDQKPAKLEEESKWLQSIEADCVLSDAAFLGW